MRALRVAGADVVRVNTGARQAQVALSLVGRKPMASIRCDGRLIEIGRVTSAWLHQLPPLGQPEHPVLPTEAALSSRLNLWDAVSGMIPERAWLNAPWRVRTAANKFIQLSLAAEEGLHVAPTVVGDYADGIRALAADRTVVKYFGDASRLWASGTGLAALTVDADIKSSTDEELSDVPLLHQAWLDARREYRVVAIGAELFVAACDKPPGLTDIRDTDRLPPYEVDTLPEQIGLALTRLLRRLHLGYCSADIALDRDGNWVFLDLNASGAFWWVDDLYDREVSAAICAKLLEIGM